MHIAICDDNIADRKQLERLLGRESDARQKTTGVLYIDSFGDSGALLKAPFVYDLFFIDLHEGDYHGLDFADELRQAGVTAPIVLCSQATDYEALPTLVSSLHYLKKPVLATDLPPVIDMALAAKAAAAHTIELRCEQDTHYVIPEKILYALPQGHLTLVHLENGEVLSMLGNLDDLFHLLESTRKFIFARRKMLVNLDCISSLSLFKMELSNGETFSTNLADYHFIKKFWPVNTMQAE